MYRFKIPNRISKKPRNTNQARPKAPVEIPIYSRHLKPLVPKALVVLLDKLLAAPALLAVPHNALVARGLRFLADAADALAFRVDRLAGCLLRGRCCVR